MNELEYVLEEALRREGPALLVFWNLRGLESFVEQANAFESEQADAPPLPYWLRSKPPQMTTLSVTMGLLEFIGRGSTQSFETMFLEYTAMMRRVDQIEQDPFMRAMLKRCYELGLTIRDIRKIKKKYDENDMYHTGETTQAEFFFIINESRRPLTTGIFQYANVSMDQKLISFDEYLLCVVSFASLTPPELFQFVFDLYDADKSGSLDEKEFATMSKELQSHQFAFPKNVATAIAMIEGKDPTGKKDTRRGYLTEDGLVDLNEFLKFTHLFPVAFFPIFNFQKNVRRVTLGENKWSRLVARKLKMQELVSHMRRKYGSIPEMTWRERLASVFDPHVMDIRKRASKIYGQEITQRQLIGDADS
ncbi:hypothetical protein Poli38472_008751 [Pythium oligandrum]|uniref:EF-hand domain-containing protein n=1 Tax=Pythium oligandrum TaxID=41045 RepID=A0A8K1C457_PYTOL|nr:hypothetical protein Poli38472_008751 [Pythium oligandrum]|eukprot:TMW56103.1 hypothetical protein Poli38472_008751 [Pythium oligandrum]